MKNIEQAYRLLLERTSLRDVQAAICQDFLLSIAYPEAIDWAPGTIGRLDETLQDAMLAIMSHLRTTPWQPEEQHMRWLRKHRLGYWP